LRFIRIQWNLVRLLLYLLIETLLLLSSLSLSLILLLMLLLLLLLLLFVCMLVHVRRMVWLVRFLQGRLRMGVMVVERSRSESNGVRVAVFVLIAVMTRR
jgi:hypothetical protein